MDNERKATGESVLHGSVASKVSDQGVKAEGERHSECASYYKVPKGKLQRGIEECGNCGYYY